MFRSDSGRAAADVGEAETDPRLRGQLLCTHGLWRIVSRVGDPDRHILRIVLCHRPPPPLQQPCSRHLGSKGSATLQNSLRVFVGCVRMPTRVICVRGAAFVRSCLGERLGPCALANRSCHDCLCCLRWSAEEGQTQIAALRIMGFWAEEWWQSFVCEQGGQEIRTTVLRMLKASLRLLTCLPAGGVRENQLVAAETVFQLLGCARDVVRPDDALCRELLDALVLACRTALAQCRQRGQSPSQLTELDQLLASATLRCLARLATESVTVLSPNLSWVAPTVLQSMQGTPSAVSVIAVELWSSLALHDIAAASCGTYAGEGLVAEFLPQLVPLLLAMLAASDGGGWSDQQLV